MNITQKIGGAAMLKKHLINEEGLSLVETLAASVLLIIVLLSFISFFNTSKHTGVESKKTVSATYTTQTEMESIYTKIQSTSTSTQSAMMQNLGYTNSCTVAQSTNYLKKSTQPKGTIITKLTPNSKQANLVNILVSIYDVDITNPCTTISTQPTSQMENIVKAGGS